MKNYIENSNIGYFLEIALQYAERLHNIQNNLPFFFVREFKLKKLKNL